MTVVEIEKPAMGNTPQVPVARLVLDRVEVPDLHLVSRFALLFLQEWLRVIVLLRIHFS